MPQLAPLFWLNLFIFIWAFFVLLAVMAWWFFLSSYSFNFLYSEYLKASPWKW